MSVDDLQRELDLPGAAGGPATFSSLVAIGGWMNQQQHAIGYLREENRILRQRLGGRRFRLSDDQRRRLATTAKLLGRRMLDGVATIVTSTPCWPGTGS